MYFVYNYHYLNISRKEIYIFLLIIFLSVVNLHISKQSHPTYIKNGIIIQQTTKLHPKISSITKLR